MDILLTISKQKREFMAKRKKPMSTKEMEREMKADTKRMRLEAQLNRRLAHTMDETIVATGKSFETNKQLRELAARSDAFLEVTTEILRESAIVHNPPLGSNIVEASNSGRRR